MHQKTSTVNTTKLVACPACKTLTAFDPKNAFRPFCSARCKMIDLGDWANEHFKISQPAIINTPEDE